VRYFQLMKTELL